MAPKYYKFEEGSFLALIRDDRENSHIEMWSTHRLPFEPKGALLAARNELRRLIRLTSPIDNRALKTVYVSPIHDFVDTENVLIYNVGTGAFRLAAQYGIEFVRDYGDVPSNAPEGSSWMHYHRYSFRPTGNDSSLNPPAVLSFSLRFKRKPTSEKPHDYWWLTKQSLNGITCKTAEITGPFQFDVVLSGPSRYAKCASILKPLFDGIISALHFDSSALPENPECLLIADKLQILPSEVAGALRQRSNSLLGERAVVAAYRDFVKWNPADERCVVGRLTTKANNSDWSAAVSVTPHIIPQASDKTAS